MKAAAAYYRIPYADPSSQVVRKFPHSEYNGTGPMGKRPPGLHIRFLIPCP